MPRVLLALVACLLATGCYTVLRHPEVRDAEPHQVQSESCTTCHSDFEMSAMEYGLHHRLGFYGDWAWWDRYYRTPWWYDDYWYWGGPGVGGGGGGAPAVDGTRRRQGESLPNERPRLPRASRTVNPAPPESAPPSGQTGRGEAVSPPAPPSGQPQEPRKEAAPERRNQGEAPKNERPPRPRP